MIEQREITWTKEEQKLHREEWIAALLSGKYKQGQEVLCSVYKEEKRYCCLGVGCDVYNSHKELDKLTAKIYKMAGVEFNINSPKQMGEVLFEKMGIKPPGKTAKKGANGNFSTKVSILEELEEANPIIKEILAYRELQK